MHRTPERFHVKESLAEPEVIADLIQREEINARAQLRWEVDNIEANSQVLPSEVFSYTLMGASGLALAASLILRADPATVIATGVVAGSYLLSRMVFKSRRKHNRAHLSDMDFLLKHALHCSR